MRGLTGLLVVGAVACGSGGSNVGGSTDDAGLLAAIAAARAVDFPDPEVRLADLGPDAVWASTGATSYVETLDLSVVDATGRAIYALRTEATRQTDPSALHVAVRHEGLREQYRRQHGAALDGLPPNIVDQMFNASLGEFGILGVGESFEMIRYGEDLWLRSGAGAPWVRRDPALGFGPGLLDREWPISVRLAEALGQYLGREPVEAGVTINGRLTDRYRVDNRRLHVRTVEGDDLHAIWPRLTTLPNVDLRGPEGIPDIVSGGLDVWVQEDGLVVRAQYEVHLADGRTFRGRAELSGFAAEVDIRPPS